MRAKQIFEFQKSGNPKQSLNLGIMSEINKRAELYNVPNWETVDFDFFRLFYLFCQFSYKEELKELAIYFLENENLKSQLDTRIFDKELNLYLSSNYWISIANYMIKYNFGLSYIKWVLSKSKLNNEDIFEGPREMRECLLTFLFNEYLK